MCSVLPVVPSCLPSCLHSPPGPPSTNLKTMLLTAPLLDPAAVAAAVAVASWRSRSRRAAILALANPAAAPAAPPAAEVLAPAVPGLAAAPPWVPAASGSCSSSGTSTRPRSAGKQGWGKARSMRCRVDWLCVYCQPCISQTLFRLHPTPGKDGRLPGTRLRGVRGTWGMRACPWR
jgi:hypothetical protein